MADGDIVRKITISATGENVDKTTSSVESLGEATAALTAATIEQTKRAQEADVAYKSQGDAAASASNVFSSSGLELASLANHLRQAGEAAYALSPAFRGLVNQSVAPVLRATGEAAAASAGLIVTGVNMTGTALLSASAAIAEVSPRLGLLSTGLASVGSSMAAFSPTVTGVAATIIGRLVPALRVLAVAKVVIDSWNLATDAIKKYNDISANAAGMSTQFYQQVVKGADDTKTSIDTLTTAFKNLNDSMAPTLGGSTAQVRLGELQKAGNFKGNTGVSALNSANNPQQQLQALADLNRQAADAQQRLAGIDLTKTILGKDIADNLAKDSDYLDKLLRTATGLSNTPIISDDQLARAVTLQTRYDAALKVLSDRWQPFKDTLTEVGMKLHETFVQDLTDLAAMSTGMQTLYDKAAALLGLGWDKLKNGLQGAVTLVDAAGNAYEANIPGQQQGPLDSSNSAMDNARARLRSGLSQPTQVANARSETNFVHDSVIRDRSGNPDKDVPDASAYDRATESINKYIQVTTAASTAVDATRGEQEKLRAVAQLTAAAMKDGTPITAALTAQMEALGQKAGTAAQELQKAKVASEIKFTTATAFLTPEDAAIAQKLKGSYDSVTEALNSTEAAAMRTADALKDIGTFGHSVASSIGTDFTSAIRSGSTAFQSLESAGLNALGKISDKLMTMATDKLWSSAFGGSSGSSLLGMFGVGGASSVGNYGQVSNATGLGAGTGGLSFPMFAAGTDNAPGGWSVVGEKGPELMNVPKGAQILPNGQMPGGGDTTHVSIPINIDATGADPAGLARVQAQLTKLQQTLPNTIVSTVKKAKTGRQL